MDLDQARTDQVAPAIANTAQFPQYDLAGERIGFALADSIGHRYRTGNGKLGARLISTGRNGHAVAGNGDRNVVLQHVRRHAACPRLKAQVIGEVIQGNQAAEYEIGISARIDLFGQRTGCAARDS